MLTPRFKLSQDENHVFMTVHAPYTNVSNTEIDIEGQNFLFVSSPYFLRLRLPGKIVDNDNSKVTYASSTGDFTMTFVKETPGENFENLDMITSLLAPRDIPDINPTLVEALDEDGIIIVEDGSQPETNSEVSGFGFGFANKTFTQFRDIGTEFPQIFDLRNPEDVPIAERHKLRVHHENSRFSADHYLADYFDAELINPYIDSNVYWDSPDFNANISFTDDEVSLLKELPNKSFLLTKTEFNMVMNGLVDILFGYCYDKRTTLNESTIESSWTINKVSATLGWFCSFTELKEAIISGYRRSLTYPIFRNYKLSEKVKRDLTLLLKHGKRLIVRCLIDIHQMFNSSNDARYILNQLFIKDYLVFVQKVRSEKIQELHMNLSNMEIKKSDLCMEIEELEFAANLVQDEEMGSNVVENEMAVRMASMSLIPGVIHPYEIVDDDEDDTSSDSSSDSSSSSDDSSSDLDSDDEVL